MRVFVTGGSGFIGSNLVDALLADGHSVTIFDNLSTGRREFIRDALTNDRCALVEADLLDEPTLRDAMSGHDAVVHLAANADVRFGWNYPRRDLEQNVIVTLNVLESMRFHGIRRILFSSTGSVYGETTLIPTPEDAPFPLQTSLYGASKLAAEGFISAYAEAGHVSATVFRFVSILGPRYTHGHVIDFVARLIDDPSTLQVLGDGGQRKSYLHVSDCVAAILARLADEPTNEVINLGVDGYCEIRDSAAWIVAKMQLTPTLQFAGGDRGWIGDNPFIYLDTSKMQGLGWQPRIAIREAVEDTVAWLLANQWVLDAASISPNTTK